jgi:hypothetical protein
MFSEESSNFSNHRSNAYDGNDALSGSHLRSANVPPDHMIGAEDAAEYIAEIVGSLRAPARNAGLTVLANLLEVAYEEALLNSTEHHSPR